jgi:hypothetical protein
VNKSLLFLAGTAFIAAAVAAQRPDQPEAKTDATEARLAKLEERASSADKKATEWAGDLAKAQADLRSARDDVSWLARTRPPVGSILPYIGDPDSLPEDWQLCNGDPLKDPESPLKSVLGDGKVPDLTSSFLKGAAMKGDAMKKSLLVRGGHASQELPHTHSIDLTAIYGTDIRNKNLKKEWIPTDHNAFVTNHHLFEGVLGRNNGDAATARVTGGTSNPNATLNVATEPPYFQVYFIIRIK